MDIFSVSLILLTVVVVLFGLFCFGVWKSRQVNSLCPYTGEPLRSGGDVLWLTAEKCLRYLYDLRQYDNQMFDLKKAAFSRATGRLFPNCLTWYGVCRVDWTFLQKRFPGHYVSWGSLSEEQKRMIYADHASLDGFQTEFSSSQPSPRKLEAEFAYAKPGPLYVDLDTQVLLGWKIIPDTDLEVLIVQKPLPKFKKT